MVDRYFYPALFEKSTDNNVYCISFPDLPGCFSCGESIEKAFFMAKAALELHLYGMESDRDQIPKPSNPENIKIGHNCFITLIEAYMPLVRDKMENKPVKKTLTIPKWLNDLAEDKKINFSQILQQGLKKQLGIFDLPK